MTLVRRFDMADPTERSSGIDLAVAAVRRGELVVLPTDTVYGLGADAFASEAVHDLLQAKGRGREMPVPVLAGPEDMASDEREREAPIPVLAGSEGALPDEPKEAA